MSDDNVHVFIGQRDFVVTRLHPQFNARHPSLQGAESLAREIAARDHGTVLIHDATGAVESREKFEDS